MTTASLPSATINVPYSQQLAVSGATGAVVWTLNTNNSPLLTWLSVSSAGVLTGTKDYMNNISIATIVVAVIGAVIAVVGYGMVTGRSRTGRGPI